LFSEKKSICLETIMSELAITTPVTDQSVVVHTQKPLTKFDIFQDAQFCKDLSFVCTYFETMKPHDTKGIAAHEFFSKDLQNQINTVYLERVDECETFNIENWLKTNKDNLFSACLDQELLFHGGFVKLLRNFIALKNDLETQRNEHLRQAVFSSSSAAMPFFPTKTFFDGGISGKHMVNEIKPL